MTEIERKKQIVRIDRSKGRRECAVICGMLFSLYRWDYNKKEGTPSWQEPVPSFNKYIPKEVSSYYDTHFQSVLQAEKNKNLRSGVVLPDST